LKLLSKVAFERCCRWLPSGGVRLWGVRLKKRAKRQTRHGSNAGQTPVTCDGEDGQKMATLPVCAL